MTAPPLLTEQEDRRNYSGWIVLGLLLTLTLVSALATILQGPSTESRKITRAMGALRQEVTTRQLSEATGSAMPADTKEFQNALDGIKPLRLTNHTAAELYAVMATEIGRPVGGKDVEVLAKSTKGEEQAFASIYAQPKLLPSDAAGLAARVKSSGLAGEVAGVHAFEKAGDKTARARILSRFGKGSIVAVAVGVVLLGLSGITWLVFIALRFGGYLQPLGIPSDALSKLDADRFAKRACDLFLTFVVLQLLLAFVKIGSAPTVNFVIAAAMIVAVYAYQRWPVWGKSISFDSLGIRKEKLGIHILWGVGGFLANLPIAVLLLLVGSRIFSFLPPPEHPATNEIQNTKDFLTIASIIFFGSVAAPIWEETMFRGLLFPAFRRFVGLIPAALISSFCFASIHPQGPAVWLSLIALACLSCGLTYQTRSLVPSMIMHATHNFVLLIWAVYLS